MLCFTQCSSSGRDPQEVWISNIIAKPVDFRNVSVKIIGIVQDIEVYPKGTRQGYYLLMDQNKQVIKVKTNSLPNVGERIVVVGVVGQDKQNAILPLLVETDRQWVWTSFIVIALTTLFFLSSLALLIYRFFLQPASINEQGRRKIYQPIRLPSEPQASADKNIQHEKAETMLLDVSEIGGIKPAHKTMTIELEVIAGPDKGKRFHFTRSSVTIGRAGRRLNDIELKDITISREQAIIKLNKAGNGFVLNNEGTTNPTLVNGQSLAVANLKTGDEILVGTTLLKFHLIE